MTVSEKLTNIGYGLAARELPDSSYAAAGKFLLDTIACAIAGHAEPGLEGVTQMMRDWGGAPEASLFCSSEKLPLPNAAFVNSVMIHALDLDDVYIPATLHLSSTLVPVVLGVAEKTNASGREALTALIIAVEVSTQLGIAERHLRRGQTFLPSSLVNGFGATVAASLLYGMPESECVNALGINYAQVSGNRQALIDMSLTKRMQPAFAARSALWSVEMAKRGITGSQNAFEGRYGYCNAYLNGETIEADALSCDPENLQVERISTKRFPSCGACHNVQLAAERLREEEQLEAKDIESVEIFNCGPGGLVGNPFKLGSHPQVDAQFSVLWAVAHTFVRGPATLDAYRDDNVRNDEEVLRFIDKISFCKAPENLPEKPANKSNLPGPNLRYQGLIVHTGNGRKIQRQQTPSQTFSPADFTLDMTKEKFRDCLAFANFDDETGAEAILAEILNLGQVASVRPLLESLAEKQGNGGVRHSTRAPSLDEKG